MGKMKVVSIVSITAGLVLAGISVARAQTPSSQAFLDVNIGVQGPSQTLETNAVFPLFGETASVAAAQTIGVAPILDARVGYRVLPRFAVALDVSGRKDESEAQAVASVPSPILFGSPTIVNLTTSGLTRREIGYHIQILWFLPLSDQLELSVFGGPSFIRLQQAVTAATVAGQTVSVSSTNETGTATGVNGGVDVTYLISTRIGVGAFVRYTGASIDLPSTSGVKVGGVQSGGGLRLRF